MCMQPEPAECMPARAVCCSEQGLVVTLVQGLLLQAHPQTLHPTACAEDQILGKLHQAVCILGLQLFWQAIWPADKHQDHSMHVLW